MRPGYKKTEIGMIPETWEVASLDMLTSRSTGVWGSSIQDERNSIRVEIVRAGDITQDGKLTSTAIRYISPNEFEKAKCSFDDLVITTSGNGLGKLWWCDGRGNTAASNFVRVLHPLTSKTKGQFLAYALRTNEGMRQLKEHTATSAYPNLRPTYFSTRWIPMPRLTEQIGIAAVLSAVDALLDGLDMLIAKKRDLKQAAMQQLLTGKTRLPGFNEAWKVKRLGEIGEISSAGVDKKLRPDEVAVRLVNYLDVYHKDFIYSRDLNHWVTAPTHQLRRCAVKKGDVFFTPTSETRNDIGLSAVAMEDIPDAAYSYHLTRLRLHEPWDLCFRTYAFKTREFLDQAEMLCDGNGTRYVISQGKFRSISISVPPVAEQAAIAAVLYGMDAELAVLMARRDKTRALKQGMMQELLTGSTRLVQLEDRHA